MQLMPGSVKIIPPLQPLTAQGEFAPIPIWRIHFSVNGTGNYYVDVPQEGYTAQKGQDAVLNLARQIAGTFGDL